VILENKIKFDTKLKAPFPYFGSKRIIADVVWKYIGDVKQYIEPFFGSEAVLLRRPPSKHNTPNEIVCDIDGRIANVWRAIQFAPEETAKWCDWPVNQAESTARRKTLIKKEQYLYKNLINDPKWYDAELAGY
jgi:DNA adenine methylase